MRRLRLAFSAQAELASEFERNIAVGGAQLQSDESFELRETVEVELVFDWRGDALVLEAEVVFASPDGHVAVQFLKAPAELRNDLAPYLPGTAKTKARGRVAEPQPPARPAAKRAKTPTRELDPAAFELEDGSPLFDDSLPATPPPLADPRGKTVLRHRNAESSPRAADPLADVADRRKSPRATARVPARVQAAHVSIEGRTRDLSETGVLISGDGSDLPLGKRVQLELQHPVTGRRIEVQGEVSRHLETDGTVAAVGIRFDEATSRRPELRELVQAARRAEIERNAAGISGRIEELGMANLLQMLGQSPIGTLTAIRGTEEATVAFENSNLRYAQLGSLHGIKAIARMLQWPDGAFSFHAQVDAITDEPSPIPLQNALLEAARQVDEAAGAAPLEMRARFDVNRDAFASAGELSKTEEAVVDLAAAGLSVRRILDVIPDADADVQGAIRSLVDREVLIPKR